MGDGGGGSDSAGSSGAGGGKRWLEKQKERQEVSVYVCSETNKRTTERVCVLRIGQCTRTYVRSLRSNSNGSR